ncbi:hypothetical protein B0H14DRAFT_2614863 [Mycena olivaceomarginata]|nr:hypothetical protein B0H14DRAFT_2614863 [Mycena olivaceomarginata]
MSQSLSHSGSPSPPGTPDTSCDHSAHLKSLILLCTPRKSGRELADLRAKLSASVDDEGRVVQHLKHRLIDVENEASNPKKRSRRSRNHRTEEIEEQAVLLAAVELTATELEARTRQTGRKFVILCGFWLCLADDDYEAFFKADSDDEYDAELRFSSDENIRQGQLREVLDILPDDLMPFRKRAWLAQAGCHATVSHSTLPFAHWLGRGEEPILIWNVPFLHGNESATLDFDEVFRYPIVFKIFACIIRGSASADGVMRGTSRLPRANAMQRIHNIQYTTPVITADGPLCADQCFSDIEGARAGAGGRRGGADTGRATGAAMRTQSLGREGRGMESIGAALPAVWRPNSVVLTQNLSLDNIESDVPRASCMMKNAALRIPRDSGFSQQPRYGCTSCSADGVGGLLLICFIAIQLTPGAWVMPSTGDMSGMLSYVWARDVLYVLVGRADLVIVRPDESAVYPPGAGACVLNPAVLKATIPEEEELGRYYRCGHPELMRLVMPTPSPAVWLGHRVVVTAGEHAGQSGLIEEIRRFDGGTESTYAAEIHRLQWDRSSGPSTFYVPVAVLARHSFDRTPPLQRFDRVSVVGSTPYLGLVGRVVDVCGFHVTVSVAASAPWRAPSDHCNVILGQRSFVVKVDALRREWRIDDVFLVQAGEHIGSLATATRAGKGDIIQLVKFSANFSDLAFDFVPQGPTPFSIIGDGVAAPRIFERSCLKHLKEGQRFEGVDVQLIKGVHKGFRGTIVGDYDSATRVYRREWEETPSPSDFAGILLSIRAWNSNQMLTEIPLEHVYHAASMLPIEEAVLLPPEVFFGSHIHAQDPPVVGFFRPIPEHRSSTPTPDSGSGVLWPLSDGSEVALTLTGVVRTFWEFDGMWMCSQAFVGKKSMSRYKVSIT